MKRARSVNTPARSLVLLGAIFSLLWGAPGCGSRLSEIVLVVDTDLIIPSEIDSVSIRTTGPSGTTTDTPILDIENVPFPRTLGLVDAGRSSAVTIQVIGRHGVAADPVALEEVHTAFVDGERRMLSIVLSASCLGNTCTPGAQTCSLGKCIPMDLPANKLLPWPGTVPPPLNQVLTPIGNRNLWAAGWRSCANKGDNVYCWGQNDNAQLGFNGTTKMTVPTRVPVTGLMKAPKSVGLGYKHTCICDADKQAWCWGLNDGGQVGPNGPAVSATATQLTPVPVLDDPDCEQISAGGSHTCAVRAGGKLWCWGANDKGQLGQAPGAGGPTPQLVAGLNAGTSPSAVSAVLQVQAGEKFTCALSSNDSVQCWGDNAKGQLGDGTTQMRATPRKVMFPAGMRPAGLALGRFFMCVLFSSQQVACWGENTDGMIGVPGGPGMNVSTPTMVQGIDDAQQIGAGHQHVCVLRQNGAVSCWGDGSTGKLGNGSITGSVVPVDVDPPIPDPIDLAVGIVHACVRSRSGVFCWGEDSNGQLGDGATNFQSQPVEVMGF
jgi:alpha-tubulin suppressor-like RCC1 family protein